MKQKSTTLVLFAALLIVVLSVFLIYKSLEASTDDSLVIINENDTYSFNWANPNATSLMLQVVTNHGTYNKVYDGSMASDTFVMTGVIDIDGYIQLESVFEPVNVIMVASPDTINKLYLPMIGK